MLKKILLGFPITLLLALLIFYFTASSGKVPTSDMHQLREYPGAKSTDSDTLTALTYNIGYLSGMTNNLAVPRTVDLFIGNLHQAKALLKEVNPDIIGFQEIDYGSTRSFNVQQLDELARGTSYNQAFQSVNWDKLYVPFPYWPAEFHFGEMLSGEAILARGKLTQDQVVTLPKPVNAPFYYNAFYLDRLVQVVDWQIGNRTIKVMNLHLEAFDKETRLTHAAAVKRLYERYANTQPVILMGDFNSVPAILPEEDGMDAIMSAENIASAIPDSLYESNPSAYYTFSSGSPAKMIDFILYNPSHITPIDARVVREAGEISDHLPVLFQFHLKHEAR